MHTLKNVVVILLMLIYGTATMGTTIQHHFCMDEYVGWSFYAATDNKCGKCGMDEKESEGCCKNENEHFKLETDHQNAQNSVLTTPVPISTLFDSPLIIDAYLFICTTATYPLCHAPPIKRESLYLFYSVFQI